MIHHDQVGFIPGLQGWFNIRKSINMIEHISKRKHKNHMILSIDAEKAFGKIQHAFLIKTPQSVGIEEIFLNIIKAIMKSPWKISFSVGKNESFSLKVRNTTGMPTLTTIVQHSAGSPSLSNQTTKRNKRHSNWHKRNQALSLHR